MVALNPDSDPALLAGVPLGRWCEPEEIAEAEVFLCSML
jgi:hypothetical protein